MSDRMEQDMVYAVAATPDVCFAARHSGLWRSADGGSQWQPIEDMVGVPTGIPATAVAVSPEFQSDGNVFAGMTGGILHSTDGGKRWAVAALSSPPPFVSALAVSPNYAVDRVIFAATLEDGVFRSTDGGVTWQAWNPGLFDRTVLSIAISPAFSQDRTVYVGTETGVFWSRNGGRAWRETGFPSDCAPVLSVAIEPQFEHVGLLFAGTESDGLFCSDNRGQSWQRVLKDAPINAILLSSAFPDTADVLAVSEDAVWLSHDGGTSWSKRSPDGNLGAGFTSAAAPFAFMVESSLLLGLSDGRVVQGHTVGAPGQNYTQPLFGAKDQ